MVGKINIIPRSELEEMHAGPLMARRRALLRCEEPVQLNDLDQGHQTESGFIELKQSMAWAKVYEDVKLAPGTRRHWKCSSLVSVRCWPLCRP